MSGFSQRLLAACDSAGLSGYGKQTQLRNRLSAMGLDVTNQSISRWFKGSMPERYNVKVIADCLNVDPVWLETGRGEMPRTSESGKASRYISLPPALWAKVDELVSSGAYENEDDVIRTALRKADL